MKKINIEHDKVSMKDEVVGSLTTDANRRQQSSTSLFSQATPYMQGATPMHGSSATPMYTGSETPMVGTPRGSTPRGGSTPSADDAYDPWKISSSHGINDRINENLSRLMYYTPFYLFFVSFYYQTTAILTTRIVKQGIVPTLFILMEILRGILVVIIILR